MKRLLKVIAIFLSVLTLMGVFSVANPVFAAEYIETQESVETAESSSEEYYGGFSESDSEENAAQVLCEDVSRREEDVKHFVMSDGSRKAVVYSEPVHYYEDNEWKEIDNTLQYNAKTEKYENKKNKFKANFGKNLNDDQLFSIENEGYELSWKYDCGLLRGAFVNGNVESFQVNNEKTEYEKEIVAENLKGKIKYKNFESNSHLEYAVTPTGVKENIVLESKNCSNEYAFEVTAEDLTLTKNSDGSISALNDENKEIFFIPAPFMYDSNSVYSYDVEYILSEKNNGKYEITVVADEGWLTDDSRAYPVVIDPAVQTQQKKSAIAMTFVASGHANTNYNAMEDVYIGVESSDYKKCRTLVKFSLPELNKGDMVVGANLDMYMYDWSFYANTTPDKQINAHLVKGSWDASTVTWNTQPTYDSVVYDYAFITRKSDWKCFDVTKAVKGWYEGTYPNYGIMVRSDVETGANADIAARAKFHSDKYNNQTIGYPLMQIQYRNNNGLESYWSYTSSAVGSAGSAYVNDYTGNLVVELPLASTISELSPVSLNAYYNTYCAGKKVTKGDNENTAVRTTIGRGWRLNVQQTVLPSSDYGLTGDAAESYPYVYTDGDGTEHYIRKVVENGKTTYEDEDGLGLTLTVDNDDCKYIISNKQGDKLKFNSEGNLGYIYDSNENCIHITYKAANGNADLGEKQRINRVYDGAGHYFQFSYHTDDSGVENDYVQYITDNAGRSIRFTIPGGYLNTVTYPDGTASNISYEPDYPTLINYIKDDNGYALNFDYKVSIASFPVSKIKEYGTNENNAFTAGQVITFNREQYNTTVVRSSGVDGVFENDDDVVRTYQFDDFGRKTSEQVQLANGKQAVAGNATYISQSADTSSNIRSANNVSSSAGLGKNIVNYLKNSNGNATTNWSVIATDSEGSLTASEATAYYGKKSLKLQLNTLIETLGRYYMRQDVSKLKGGDTYTFSLYAKVTEYAKAEGATDHGVYLAVRGLNGSTLTGSAVYSAKLCEVTNTSIDNGYRRLTATIQLPADANGLRVYAGIMNGTGTVYFDGMQVEASEEPNPYNFLYNSSFEIGSTMPTGWTCKNYTYSETSTGAVENGISHVTYKHGDYAIRITGDTSKEKYLYQIVPVEADQNDTYIVSGWGAANAVNDTFHNTTANKAKFEILATVYFKDANGNEISEKKNYSAVFNTTISGWQYSSKAFSLQFKDHPEYVPYQIRIMPRYKHQENHAYFDHIQLIKDVAQSYVYDSEGNLVTASANAEQKNNMTYDGEDNLQEYTDVLGNKTTFNYEKSTHNLLKSTSPRGMTTEYDYATNGNLTDSTTSNASGTMKIETQADYYGANSDLGIKTGAYIKNSYDQHGNATLYKHDWATGAKKSVTNANGKTTTYTYDKDSDGNVQYNRLLGVSSEGSQVGYTYSGNQLEEITFGTGDNAERYSFTYDKFGNVLETKVGTQSLSRSTYGESNGLLQSTEYGNGSINRYVYDEYGNTTEIIKDMQEQSEENSETEPVYPKTSYSWGFNSGGTNTSHSDFENNKKYLYAYDSIGRLIRQEIQANDTLSHIGSTEFQYDLRNNLTKFSLEMGGRTLSQSYKYTAISGNELTEKYEKENLPVRYSITSNRYIDYSYDSLNRLNLKTLNLNNATVYTNYIYKSSERNEGTDQTYRTTQLNYEIIDNSSFRYYYDNVGNITKIKTGKRVTDETNSNPSNNVITDEIDYRSYEYDGLNQLTRETDYSQNKTFTYEYDNMGNITNKTVTTYPEENLEGEPVVKSIDYTYGNDGKTSWNKLLTSVDLDGDDVLDDNESITYDEIGNPKSYLGAKLSWFGRQLQTYKKGDLDISYTYDSAGLRGSKTIANGEKITYQYVGNVLYYQHTANADGTTNNEMYFYYDSYGKLSGIRYYVHTGTEIKEYTYYVLTNSFGDVLALYGGDGLSRVRYEYDTWGNILKVYTCTHATVDGKDVETLTECTDLNNFAHRNPFRYRSYYYDAETGLYYLQSRYYNPEIGRFLNADGLLNGNGDILGYNMFAYCSNNPVVNSDPNGMGWKDFLSGFLDVVFDLMSKSNNKKISLIGQFLSAVKGGYDTGDEIVSIENPLRKTDETKRQYVQDIYDIGVNEKTAITTPDPVIFPDVDEYNARCKEKFNELSSSPIYSDTLNNSFDVNEAQNTIICWDFTVTCRLVSNTVYVSFTETMVEIVEALYGE